MSSYQPVDEIGRPASLPIYERLKNAATSRDVTGSSRAAGGAVAGAALWFTVSELGFPELLGLGRISFLPLAMAIGAVAGITRFARWLVLSTAALLGLLLVVAFTPVMEGPTARLVRRDAAPVPADAIVVLSAGVTLDGKLPQQALDRLIKGVELARAGVAPRIVKTREMKTVRGRPVTADLDQNRIAALAETEVITTGEATSTRGEALRVKEIATREGWNRIVLVTSPFHSRRACATFEKVGLVLSCIPADSRDIAVLNLVGPGDRVRAFAMWTYELAGTLRYWIAGWI